MKDVQGSGRAERDRGWMDGWMMEGRRARSER